MVCPGFVDAHVHGDLPLLADPLLADPALKATVEAARSGAQSELDLTIPPGIRPFAMY